MIAFAQTNKRDTTNSRISKNVSLKWQYSSNMVKQQINQARQILRSNLLEDWPKRKTNSHFQPTTENANIINNLQLSLTRIFHYPKHLVAGLHLHTDNPKVSRNYWHIMSYAALIQQWGLCHKPRCQLCPHIYSDSTITGSNNITQNMTGSFTYSSANMICYHLRTVPLCTPHRTNRIISTQKNEKT